MLNGNEVFQKNSSLVTRKIEKDTILMPVYTSSTEMNCIYSLNATATFVWELFDGKKNIEEIKEAVMNEYSSSENDVNQELKTLLTDLKEINAVIKK